MGNENKTDWYSTQKAIKSRHYKFIANTLQNNGPMLFNELLKSGREADSITSPMGLSRILDDLEAQGVINQNATKKDSRGIARKAYALTGFGAKIAQILPSGFSVYEQYELKGLSKELIKAHAFIEDIIANKNAFSDKRLGLNVLPNRLWNFEYLIKYSLLLDNKLFEEKLAKYMARFADRKRFRTAFGKIDFDLADSFIKAIISGNDPLDSKSMLQKLIVKGRGSDVDLPIFTYINAAKILRFGDADVYQKLTVYERDKWKEFYEENSKLRRLINETRGAIE